MSASDSFHVVIPSMPGYGFSGKPTTTGWDPARIARAWVVLMKRLGFTQFVAQGGDWGAMVADVMATQAPPELRGIHLNWPFTVPPDIDKALQTGNPLRSDLSADERRACEQLDFFYKKGVGYALEMANRPQTLYGIADSPIGLAAFLLDHDARSYELVARTFDGQLRGLTRRCPRQHHAVLVDEYGDFVGAYLLGKQVRLFRPERGRHTCRGERLS